MITNAQNEAVAETSGKNISVRVFGVGGAGIKVMELMLKEIGRERLLVPVPWPLAQAIGAVGDIGAVAHGLLPLIPEPPLTSDQVALLRADNVVSAGAAGLADLGVAAAALEPIIPTYLYPFRKGGQYADLEPPREADSIGTNVADMSGGLNAA